MNLKNPLADRTESLDEDGSAMETVVDEEDDISTDITDDTLLNTDDQISIDGQNCNTDAVNIVHSENADCLVDIDHANASIDFANVKLETYIFSETNDGNIGVDNILSIPVGKDLFNENNGNAPMGNHLFNGNSAENNPIESHLFNGNSEENNSIASHLFNRNNGDNRICGDMCNGSSAENTPINGDLFNVNNAGNAAIGTNLFNGDNQESSVAKGLYTNGEETVNPVDILEYIAEMPENNSLFVPGKLCLLFSFSLFRYTAGFKSFVIKVFVNNYC